MEQENKIKELKEKVEQLEQELQDTKSRLQKYTNPQRHKKSRTRKNTIIRESIMKKEIVKN